MAVPLIKRLMTEWAVEPPRTTGGLYSSYAPALIERGWQVEDKYKIEWAEFLSVLHNLLAKGVLAPHFHHLALDTISLLWTDGYKAAPHADRTETCPNGLLFITLNHLRDHLDSTNLLN